VVTGMLVALVMGPVRADNLLRNPSFELVPCETACIQDQGAMPSEWIVLGGSPDTFSNDGSYGLPPEGFGNFTGATAQDGIRWLVGASFVPPESFGQELIAPLLPHPDH